MPAIRFVPTREELFRDDIDLREHASYCGTRHPLAKFARALPLTPAQWEYANFLMRAITAQDAATVKEAEEFLLYDEEWFPLLCDLAGIDAEKLRNHLIEQSVTAVLDSLEEMI